MGKLFLCTVILDSWYLKPILPQCTINDICHCRCILCKFLPAKEQNQISPEFSLWPHCLHSFPTLLFLLAFRSAGEESSINSAALSFICAPPLNGMSVVVMVRTWKLPDLSNRLELSALLLLPQHVQPWQCSGLFRHVSPPKPEVKQMWLAFGLI